MMNAYETPNGNGVSRAIAPEGRWTCGSALLEQPRRQASIAGPPADRPGTDEPFSRFLNWLSPDPETAGVRYESVRRALIYTLRCRGCVDAEELADEAIDRVVRRIDRMADTYVGDPAHYLLAVARNLHLEYVKKRSRILPLAVTEPSTPVSETVDEALYERLDRSLGRLAPEDRELILQYYCGEKRNKIASRNEMAVRHGLCVSALRVRVHRIRVQLRDYMDSPRNCSTSRVFSRSSEPRRCTRNSTRRDPYALAPFHCGSNPIPLGGDSTRLRRDHRRVANPQTGGRHRGAL